MAFPCLFENWEITQKATITAFILWNNSALSNLQSLLDAVFYVVRGPSRCGNTFAFATANFFIQLCNANAVLVTCPRTNAYRKGHSTTLIVGLAGSGIEPGPPERHAAV
jgi:hypothetical protein